jgi:hypothetical protein
VIDIKFSQFFDRQKIIDKVGAAKRKVLSKAGAFVRRTARRSIQTSKKTAPAGHAPNDHGGWLRRWILFAYDEDRESVVIGPKLLNGSKKRGSTVVPLLLELGGETIHWRTNRPATYAPHPYMEPALEAERPKFPDLFANSVK